MLDSKVRGHQNQRNKLRLTRKLRRDLSGGIIHPLIYERQVNAAAVTDQLWLQLGENFWKTDKAASKVCSHASLCISPV